MNSPNPHHWFTTDDRGVLGYLLAIILGATLITSVVVMGGLNTQTSAQQPDSSASVDSVKSGVSSGLDESNDIMISGTGDGTYSGSAVNWDMDSEVAQKNLGSLLTSIQTQQETSGEVTKVEPAEEGSVKSGSYLKQKSDSSTTTVTYTDYYEVEHTHSQQETRYDYDYEHTHTDYHTHNSYDYTHTHYNTERVCHARNCWVGGITAIHGHTEWVSGYSETHTYTYTTTETEWYSYSETHTWTHYHDDPDPFCGVVCNIPHQHSYSHTHWDSYEVTVWETGSYTHWHDGYYTTVDYEHVYQTYEESHTHDDYCSGCDRFVDYTYSETHTSTHDHESYCSGCDRYLDHTYEVTTYYTETHDRQEEKTKTMEIAGSSFAHPTTSDPSWEMMDNVNEYRDSQITIQKDGLDEREENAFQLDTGADTVTIWQSNNNIKVRVSGGSVQTLTGDSLTIDPADETLRGSDGTTIDVAFGDSLSVTNGNHAYGHYELVSDGDMPTLAGDTTLADGESFVSVNDIVYSADLEVTYESGDTTVTSRMYLEPDVTSDES